MLPLSVLLFAQHQCIVALDESRQAPPQKRRKFGSKVSSVTLSEIDMMRRLVQHLTDSPASWKKRSSACAWKGVKCNSESRVTHLHWGRFDLSGNITWSYLPPNVAEVNAESSTKTVLTGELHSADLTTPLSQFDVLEHKHHGVFDFTLLPAQLRKLYVSSNRLVGSADLTQLPQNMFHVYASNNLFEGPLALHALPPSMEVLYLGGNHLTGTLDLDHLPQSMRILSLENNHFIGTLNVSSIQHLCTLDVSHNQLSGVVDLTTSGLDRTIIDLRGNLFHALIYHRFVSRKGFHRSDKNMTRYTPKKYAELLSKVARGTVKD